jgi:hypothetical protein
MTSVNLRLGKEFRIGGGRAVGLDLDVFNLLNAATPSAAMYASGPTFGYVTQVLDPRVVRVGGRLIF